MSNSELNTAWIVGKIVQNKRFALRPIRHPSLPRIPRLFPDSVELGDKIGQGGFGKGATVAVKQVIVSPLGAHDLKGIRNELRQLGRLKSSAITTMTLCCRSPEFAKGLDSGHAEGIIHGDLKATNILLDQFLTPKYVGSLHGNLPRVFQRLVSSFLALDPTLRPSLAVAQDFLNVYMDNAPPPLAFPTLSLNTIATTIPVITRPETPESPNDPFPEIDPFQSNSQPPRRKYLKAAYYFSKERFSDAIRQFEQSKSLHQPLSQRALGLCNRALREDADASSGRRKVAILKDNSISPGASTMGMGLKVMTSSLSVGTRRRPSSGAAARLRNVKWISHMYEAITQETDSSALAWLLRVFKRGACEAFILSIRGLARNGNANARFFLTRLHYLDIVPKSHGHDHNIENRNDHDLYLWLLRSGIGGNNLARLGVSSWQFPIPEIHESSIYEMLKTAASSRTTTGGGRVVVLLGKCYALGIGVPQDQEKALELYRKAAGAGDAYAEYMLGICHRTGMMGFQTDLHSADCHRPRLPSGSPTGAAKDKAKANEWFLMAAENGSVIAMLSLAENYDKGDGIQQDHAKARRWSTAAKAC
ncbi:LOW QUALITY PROTEIN: hypothetical protein BC936DRAFT_146554 [Jimgerdemannia flammicorona]|uniref:Protein kinase domain-containing protein n=1 Tax=Jimgerdemannia flammicorona TaxID=994334 RepID=A0A433D7E1_9FUNG|nr:LOW QUALITY PROTEIN: hypothetical protein BC936DRAFT_146554 [Jimgerdemannia flammicorona]